MLGLHQLWPSMVASMAWPYVRHDTLFPNARAAPKEATTMYASGVFRADA